MLNQASWSKPHTKRLSAQSSINVWTESPCIVRGRTCAIGCLPTAISRSRTSASLGTQVKQGAFNDLLECVTVGDFDTCDAIKQGDPNGRLVNPLGGISVDMAGPAR